MLVVEGSEMFTVSLVFVPCSFQFSAVMNCLGNGVIEPGYLGLAQALVMFDWSMSIKYT